MSTAPLLKFLGFETFGKCKRIFTPQKNSCRNDLDTNWKRF
jgi:hypothetical protein